MFHDVDPNDIYQGMLGDCWLLSALSACAEFDLRVQNLFITDKPSQSGVYEVKLIEMGHWRNVVFDDFVPCKAGTKELAFSGPRVEHGVTELWVILLEKAWAKIYASFQRLEGGFTKDALNDLTGAPVEDIETDHPKAWDKILFGEKN